MPSRLSLKEQLDLSAAQRREKGMPTLEEHQQVIAQIEAKQRRWRQTRTKEQALKEQQDRIAYQRWEKNVPSLEAEQELLDVRRQSIMQWMRQDPHGFSTKMKERYPTATEEQISGLFTKVGMKPPSPVWRHPEIPIEGPLPSGYSTGPVWRHPEIPITDPAPLVGTVKSGSVPAPQRTDDAILTERMRK